MTNDMVDDPIDQTPGKDEGQHGTKVDRVIRENELAGLGEELERRWLGVDGERHSLRNLAGYFNRRVLEAALEGANEQPIDGEIENHYRLLTSDDVSASARTQVEARLTRLGIDIESLRRDFVSHQAVHTYLTDVREVSLTEDEPSADTVIQSRQETILRLRNRLVAVIERSLESLRDAGHLTFGEFDVIVSTTVYCDDCGTSLNITELFDQGGCDCRDETL